MGTDRLIDLFTHICGVARIDSKTLKEYYQDWYKLVKMYDFKVVLRAWDSIKIMDRSRYPDPYFNLNTWVNQLDLYHKQQRVEYTTPTTKFIHAPDTEAWKNLLNQFINREITRAEWLQKGLETGLLSQEEHDKQTERYNKLEMPLNEKCGGWVTYEG